MDHCRLIVFPSCRLMTSSLYHANISSNKWRLLNSPRYYIWPSGRRNHGGPSPVKLPAASWGSNNKGLPIGSATELRASFICAKRRIKFIPTDGAHVRLIIRAAGRGERAPLSAHRDCLAIPRATTRHKFNDKRFQIRGNIFSSFSVFRFL